jgi:phenylpropionate dioxygenase-like ring-hydroxylating dioxygenase large terminal subunit
MDSGADLTPAVLTPQEQQYPLGPSLLDIDVCHSPTGYRRELDHALLRGGFPVVPSSDVAEPRDFLVWEQLEQSVLICRLDEGTVSAWHDVCWHRGARLVEGAATAVGEPHVPVAWLRLQPRGQGDERTAAPVVQPLRTEVT